MFATWMVLNTVFTNLKSEKGQGMAEYALIIALVAIALVAGLGTLQGGIEGVFGEIVAAF
jgi:pilus assembly protein Flp/PilA